MMKFSLREHVITPIQRLMERAWRWSRAAQLWGEASRLKTETARVVLEKASWGSATVRRAGETVRLWAEAMVQPAPLMPVMDARDLLEVVLKRLGESLPPIDVMDAFRHAERGVSLPAFRNALCDFGFKTIRMRQRLRDIDERVGLVLFVDDMTGALVLLDFRNPDRPQLYSDGAFQPIGAGGLERSGRAFAFQKDDEPDLVQGRGQNSWFSTVLSRFSGYGYGLVVVSIAVNILAITVPIMIMVVYDHVIGHQSDRALPMLASALVLLVLFDCVFRFIKARVLARLAGRLDYILGVHLLRKLLRLSSGRMNATPVASQIQRLKEFEAIRDIFTGPLASAATEIPFAILLLAALIVIAGPLTIVPITGGLLLVALNIVAARWGRQNEQDVGRTRSAVLSMIVETMDHRSGVERAHASEAWCDRFRALSARASAVRAHQMSNTATVEALSISVMNAAALGTVVGGAWMVMAGALSVGGLIATMALVWRLLSPFQVMALAAAKIAQVRRSVLQINSFFALPDDRVSNAPVTIANRRIDSVSFDRVSFRYNAQSNPALLGATFSIKPREMVAIVGPTGAGKTAIATLIMRLHEPQAGVIRLGGVDIRQFAFRDLRRSIGYVPQTDHLFEGTIEQNITLGLSHYDEATLQWTIEQVGLDRVMESTGCTLDTRIGYGDRRKIPDEVARGIAFARGLIRRPKILLLDEPEKGLGQTGVDAFMDFLDTQKGERTLIMISHRPSFIKKADRALLIKGGTVADDRPANDMVKRVGAAQEAA